jgi:hypothetical protein
MKFIRRKDRRRSESKSREFDEASVRIERSRHTAEVERHRKEEVR